jgi:cellulose biosynthesis protein BcsQ
MVRRDLAVLAAQATFDAEHARHAEGRLGGSDGKIEPNVLAVGDGLLKVVSMGFLVDDESDARDGLRFVLEKEAKDVKADRILLDTSPFYGGGTHLSWCAVEALVVPVRVDEHSLESLDLLFKFLSDKGRDFQLWNGRAGDLAVPKIAAIVMTMVGSKSQVKSTPDQASRMYIERALSAAQKHSSLFNHEDPTDAFVLTDDFHSAGRISGAKRIPLAELVEKSFHTVGNRRLQVNRSVLRYQHELKYLASLL